MKMGKLKNQVTNGNWEVTNYYGFDEKNQTVFYQSVENGSINRDVYRIGLNGKNKVRLSQNTGTNAATFSPNFNYFINSFSSASQPTTYTLNDAGNYLAIVDTDNNGGNYNYTWTVETLTESDLTISTNTGMFGVIRIILKAK